MKVGIVIITFNIDCRITILQIESIKKYCTDENYTIEIVDNSSDRKLSNATRHHVEVRGVKFRKMESNSSDPSISHSFAANLSYQKMIDDYDIFFFLDHDCIPVKQFSVEAMLNGKIAGGVLSGKGYHYFWPGCFIFDNNKVERDLINFSPVHERNFDTGGALYKFKDKYNDDEFVFFDEVGCQNNYFPNHPQYYFYMIIYKETFVHFLNGSNWRNVFENERRINSLITIVGERQAENDLLLNK